MSHIWGSHHYGQVYLYGDKGIRTPGLCIANASLYQLSYIPDEKNITTKRNKFANELHCLGSVFWKGVALLNSALK